MAPGRADEADQTSTSMADTGNTTPGRADRSQVMDMDAYESERKKKNMQKLLRYYTLDSSGCSLLNLKLYLWALDNTNKSCKGFKLPDTVIIRDGQPVHWLFTSKEGEIKRKSEAKLNNRKLIVKTMRGKDKAHNEIIALYIRKQHQNYVVTYMDHYQLEEALHDEILQDGLIQKMVASPYPNSTNVLTAMWHPNVFYLESSTCEMHPGLVEENPTMKGIVSRDSVPDRLQQRVRGACASIAKHVNEVSPHGYSISSMTLQFKHDVDGTLWLLWCAGMEVRTSAETNAAKEAGKAKKRQSARRSSLSARQVPPPLQDLPPPSMPSSELPSPSLSAPAYSQSIPRDAAGLRVTFAQDLRSTPPANKRASGAGPSESLSRVPAHRQGGGRGKLAHLSPPRGRPDPVGERRAAHAPVGSKSASFAPPRNRPLAHKGGKLTISYNLDNLISADAVDDPRPELGENTYDLVVRKREAEQAMGVEAPELPVFPDHKITAANLKPTKLPHLGTSRAKVSSPKTSGAGGGGARRAAARLDPGYETSGVNFSLNASMFLPTAGGKAWMYDRPGEVSIRAAAKYGFAVGAPPPVPTYNGVPMYGGLPDFDFDI